jgi:hypothetical protein
VWFCYLAGRGGRQGSRRVGEVLLDSDAQAFLTTSVSENRQDLKSSSPIKFSSTRALLPYGFKSPACAQAYSHQANRGITLVQNVSIDFISFACGISAL